MADNRKRKWSQLSSGLASKTDVSNSLISAVENGELQVVRQLIKCFGLSYSSKCRWNGYILLRKAIKRNKHREVIKLLLTSGCKVNRISNEFTDAPDNTPLHYAVLNDDMEIVKMLLDRSANIEAKNWNGKTPLHIAAENGYSQIAEFLLKHGANVNCVYSMPFRKAYTPLHLAAEKGCEKTVKLLLSKGADINAKFCRSKTSTPLYSAIDSKNEQIVKILLEHAANVKPQNKYCNTILHLAVERGCSSAIIEQILEYTPITPEYTNISALLNAAIAEGCLKIVDKLLKCGINVNMFDSLDRRTPLHNATIGAQEEVAELLIKYGADVNAKDDDEKTSIFYAIENADLKMIKLLLNNGADIKDTPELLNDAVILSESNEIIELLLQYGANINASDEYGMTALHCTTSWGEYDKGEIAKLLLRRGANVDAQDNEGETTLFAATTKGNAKVVEALLEYKANVNLSISDITPIHISCGNRETVITTMLLSKGADVNAKKEDGTTPLHIAVQNNCKDIVEVLLNYGAKVDAKFKGNKTSIHLAAEQNSVEIAEMLLKYGADIDIRDKRGRTALHLASKRDSDEMVVTLLESGADVNILNKNQRTPIDCCNRNYSRSAEILQEHIIKMKSANLYLHTTNLEITGNSDNSYLSNACNKELKRMKNEKIGNISFHDILTKNINQMTHYARNEDIIQTLKSDDYKTKFPLYASIINNHFKKAVFRMELLEKLRTFINIPLPYICTEKIFSYLNIEDLRDFLCLETSSVESVIEIYDSDSSTSFYTNSDSDSYPPQDSDSDSYFPQDLCSLS